MDEAEQSRTVQNTQKHAKVKIKNTGVHIIIAALIFISMLVLNIVAKWHYYICVVMVITLLLVYINMTVLLK